MRGYPTHDVSKCIGCDACSQKCPTDSIVVKYSTNKVVWILNLARCIRCCYCVDNCPTGALSIGSEYSYIANMVEDMYIIHEIDIAKCVCGRLMNYSENVLEFLKDKVKTEIRCEKCKFKKLSTFEKFGKV